MISQDFGVKTSICKGKNHFSYKVGKVMECYQHVSQNHFVSTLFSATYTVTLKIRRSLKALNTDKPKEPAFGLKCDHMTSNTLPEITMQSKRLNEA